MYSTAALGPGMWYLSFRAPEWLMEFTESLTLQMPRELIVIV